MGWISGASVTGRCPTCQSPQPSQHPAISGGGEVTRLCQDEYHGRFRNLSAYKPMNPEWTFTERDFKAALGIPEDASLLSFHLDYALRIVTIIGSTRLCPAYPFGRVAAVCASFTATMATSRKETWATTSSPASAT